LSVNFHVISRIEDLDPNLLDPPIQFATGPFNEMKKFQIHREPELTFVMPVGTLP
jgi:hypothetical protein